MSVPRALRIVALWVALAVAPVARAHGGPPVIEAALASDETGPFVVELSEGFAVRSEPSSDASWSFVCPALFGTDLPPPSASVAGQAWLAGADDLYRIESAPAVTAMNRPELAGTRVLAMADLAGAPLVLRMAVTDGQLDGSEVVRADGEQLETVYGTQVLWSALAVLPESADAEAQLWLARIEADGIELLGLSTDGIELDRQLVLSSTPPLVVRISTAGEHVFAHVTENGSYTLLHVATRGEPAFPAVEVVRASLPVRGPALRDGEVLLTRDAELLSWTPDGVTPSPSPLGDQPLTCLTPELVCTQRAMYLADDVEQAGFENTDALLDLAQLRAPQLTPDDADLQQQCDLQWMVFRADLVRVGIMTLGGPEQPIPDAGPDTDAGDADAGTDGGTTGDAGDAPRAPAPSDGCAVSRARVANDGHAYVAIALWIAAAVRMRRKRQTSRD